MRRYIRWLPCWFASRVDVGELRPRLSGLAWWDYCRNEAVCFVVPLHFPAALLRVAWWKFSQPGWIRKLAARPHFMNVDAARIVNDELVKTKAQLDEALLLIIQQQTMMQEMQLKIPGEQTPGDWLCPECLRREDSTKEND